MVVNLHNTSHLLGWPTCFSTENRRQNHSGQRIMAPTCVRRVCSLLYWLFDDVFNRSQRQCFEYFKYWQDSTDGVWLVLDRPWGLVSSCRGEAVVPTQTLPEHPRVAGITWHHPLCLLSDGNILHLSHNTITTCFPSHPAPLREILQLTVLGPVY